MRAYDVIKKKRDGYKLTAEEIKYFVDGYTSGEIPDYQAAAFCMAIYFSGMDDDETTSLTFAFRDSGKKADFSKIDGIRVDKHSTGGVGDKTSLVVAPIVASLGLKVAKMSGRGLGHTGGTVDKLQSIDGFDCELSQDEFIDAVNCTGMAIIGQTEGFAPADKKFYALRDVTATVDSIPLIASSIMGKKLAADDDVIVLDVKVGDGAFMKTEEDGVRLAEIMVEIGKRAGKKIVALVTDMDNPLGKAIGNSLEIEEAIEILKGNGDMELTDLCVSLAGEILTLADYGDVDECIGLARNAIFSGKALKTFENFVAAQGGNPNVVRDYSLFKKAKYSLEIKARKCGYVAAMHAQKYGEVSLLLGAGRNKMDDEIDYSAGILLDKKVGDEVRTGERIATLFTDEKSRLEQAAKLFESATVVAESDPIVKDRVIRKVY